MKWLVIVACLAAPTFATAQPTKKQTDLLREQLRPQFGTLQAALTPGFAGGSLNSCLIEFNWLGEDWKYKTGGMIKVTGSFGLMGSSNKMGVLLKVVLLDLDLNTLQLQPSAPASAYFINNLRPLKPLGFTGSDTPGGIVSAYDFVNTSKLLVERIADGKVSIGFSRARGGSDIVIDVDVDVQKTTDDGQRTRSGATATDFFACVQELLKPQ